MSSTVPTSQGEFLKNVCAGRLLHCMLSQTSASEYLWTWSAKFTSFAGNLQFTRLAPILMLL